MADRSGDSTPTEDWCATHNKRVTTRFVAAVCPNDIGCVVEKRPKHSAPPKVEHHPSWCSPCGNTGRVAAGIAGYTRGCPCRCHDKERIR